MSGKRSLLVGWLAAAATAIAATWHGLPPATVLILVVVIGFCATFSALWSR